MMADASDMLAAALEQMDGIIAGSKAMDYSNGLFDCQSPSSPFMGNLRALHLLEDLRGILELLDNEGRNSLRCQIPDSTAESMVEWLQGRLSNGHINVGGGDHYQERLTRLEGDKESLVLQVSVLTDQVEAQGEKIRDLDVCLDEHREKLNATEEMLQQELLCRTALENQKLELISELSNLKLKQNSLEKEQLDFDERSRDSEDLILEINELRYRLTEHESEKQQYEKKLKTTKEEIGMLRRQLEGKDGEMDKPQEETGFKTMASSSADPSERDVEVQRMKKAVESLMASNEEKDLKIEELKQSLLRYKKVQDMVMSVQGKKEKPKDNEHVESNGDGSSSCLPADHVFVDQDELKNAASQRRNRDELELINRLNDDGTPSPSPADTEQVAESAEAHVESSLDAAMTVSHNLVERSKNDKNTSEEIIQMAEKPPVNPPATSIATAGDESFGSKKARSSFGKGFFKLRGGKKTGNSQNLDRSRSASAPMLAETEHQGTDHLDLAGLPQRSANSDSTNTLSTTPEGKKKSKGIKKLFGKLRRSQSTTFDLDANLPPGDFKRGGVRATAGPRLGWSRDFQQVNNDVDAPFARWSKDQVCDWLQDQGLGLYVNMAHVWISSGQTLLQASQQDLERELGIKHPLHRKKLQLALQALGSEEEDSKGKLDYNWVTRWLDDIGLPQYKTQFDEGRVDGRMLHYMTVDDLLSLKVGSVLHHLSIKRAIQVLRLNNYQPNCLRRRPSDENNISPAEISQWTNHRVMEWLRSADLAEYAPNLRGSGVHGGLMVLEPRFNVETMALLLNIPPNKTLLRRHLATHFNLLVGSEAQQLKQECLENPDYMLLTATIKVKPRKLSFGNFGSLRKKRQEESEEYVCPMDVEMPKGRSFQKGFELQIYEDDLDRLDQMDDSEGTVRQIGAFSEEIQNLTSMLKEDEFFKMSHSPNPSVTDDDSTA
ncbi:liprin-beta-1-like isoform X6 [Entelurus aequoreus]|uniref:liprin-beta-1b isoform X6 n=1 Tax=Entelurus aequoreus TaxID=161455 RepID=UPI002B1DACF8|nr:liprin-beta-1b isoform X6 [Entelurus aequoreus]XP_061891853.1 liprin-beta-1-like isoform X6 [Entelurus aequoreus]